LPARVPTRTSVGCFSGSACFRRNGCPNNMRHSILLQHVRFRTCCS